MPAPCIFNPELMSICADPPPTTPTLKVNSRILPDASTSPQYVSCFALPDGDKVPLLTIAAGQVTVAAVADCITSAAVIAQQARRMTHRVDCRRLDIGAPIVAQPSQTATI